MTTNTHVDPWLAYQYDLSLAAGKTACLMRGYSPRCSRSSGGGGGGDSDSDGGDGDGDDGANAVSLLDVVMLW